MQNKLFSSLDKMYTSTFFVYISRKLNMSAFHSGSVNFSTQMKKIVGSLNIKIQPIKSKGNKARN
jgi:hypothetical protein